MRPCGDLSWQSCIANGGNLKTDNTTKKKENFSDRRKKLVGCDETQRYANLDSPARNQSLIELRLPESCHTRLFLSLPGTSKSSCLLYYLTSQVVTWTGFWYIVLYVQYNKESVSLPFELPAPAVPPSEGGRSGSSMVPTQACRLCSSPSSH
jgi:hypothetical protein